MEESILSQKQIRHYFKCFSEHQWNRVSRATMMLGIQHLTMTDARALGGDFSRLGLEDLEDLVGKSIGSFIASIVKFEFVPFALSFLNS